MAIVTIAKAKGIAWIPQALCMLLQTSFEIGTN